MCAPAELKSGLALCKKPEKIICSVLKISENMTTGLPDQLGIPVMEACLNSVQLTIPPRTVGIAGNPSGHEYIALYRERNFTEPEMWSQKYETSTSCRYCIYHL